MRWDARVDRNQPEIVEALRAIGATVQPLHRVGGGVPDLLVGFFGEDFKLEVKDGKKPPSDRRLTPAQKEWHRCWRGKPPIVVMSIEEAFAAIGAVVR